MINYFKRLLTGYTFVRKKINGVEYRYKYSGKSIFFDPLLMLKEYQHRSADSPVESISSLPSSKEWESIGDPLKQKDFPSVVCTCLIRGKELRVSRYTSKLGVHPISTYVFELDRTPFGSFRRIYDYGAHFPGWYQSLTSLSLVENSTQERFIFQVEHGGVVFLEKFGHTQVWYFLQPDQIKLCLSTWTVIDFHATLIKIKEVVPVLERESDLD